MIKREDGTIELTFTLSWSNIQNAFEVVMQKTIDNTEIDGFRKGKAPKEMVEPKLDKSKLYGQAVQDLLPEAYSKIIKEHNLKPILYPKLNIKSGKEGEDWIFEALVCELPEIELPKDYIDQIKTIKIEKDQDKLVKILELLSSKAKIQIPEILIEEESNHRLAALVDNITKVGLSIDKYLESKKVSLDEFKAKLALEAKEDLVVEFILNYIQNEQKVSDRKQVLDYLIGLL